MDCQAKDEAKHFFKLNWAPCRVVALDGKIVLIRPKLVLCDEDNYRETRWFTAWTKVRQTEDFYLPRFIREVTGQTKVLAVK